MTHVGTPRFETIRAAVRMTEEACRLPAVATLDWLDRAASVLRGVVTPSRVCIMITNAAPGARTLGLEAAGFAATAGIGPDDGVELSVRSKAERLSDLGFPIENEVVLGRIGDLITASDWRTHGIGRLWQNTPISDVLVAASPLGRAEPGRYMISQVALAEEGAEPKPGQFELLGVIHNLLVRRALVSIGEAKATSSRWLTAREQEVLELLVVGKSVRVIAEELGRSPHTVHDHVKSLHRKLDASSRGELVAKALGHAPAMDTPPAAAPQAEGFAEMRPMPKTATRLQGGSGVTAQRLDPANVPASQE
jgi:DNA-binding CsgD family transcriptional regulator